VVATGKPLSSVVGSRLGEGTPGALDEDAVRVVTD
jgi:hypothetical protein